MKSKQVIAMSLGLLLLAGCSSFQRDWKRAAKLDASTTGITGRWEGQWLSAVNGHHGKLRCLLSQEPDGHYAARFRATYLHILSFSYTVALEVNSNDVAWVISGEEDLGAAAGGLYQYQGTVTETNFHATYQNKYDHGVFEMLRP